MWVQNDGLGSYNPHGKDWGLIYPRGTAGLVWSDGILWVGKVQDGGQPVLRAGGTNWSSGALPGVIISKGVAEDFTSPSARAFRVRRDYRTADLRQEASEYFDVPLSDVTSQQVAQIRSQYDRDWKEWPWQKGAPFRDLNGDGIMDGDDYPDFFDADQLIWFAYNDIYPTAWYQQKNIGLEVQTMLWAYDGISEVENVVFKRYRIIYKGLSSTPANAVIDSMYLSQFAETDVGFFADDLGGCDSVLSLGFAYNSTAVDSAYRPYMQVTPAIGYVILQGPIVPSQTDEALFGFEKRKGFKNLPMTSFVPKPTPSAFPETGDYGFASWLWNGARGFFPLNDVILPPYMSAPIPWIDPSGMPTRFPLAGDPVTRQGWVDGIAKPSDTNWMVNHFLYPGGRRIYVNTGPFTLALGDTQEIVTAAVTGLGYDGPHSVQVMKSFASLASFFYPSLPDLVQEGLHRVKPETQSPGIPKDYSLKQNYPNPFNPSTRIDFAIPIDADIKLVVYDLLGRRVKVLDEGFRLAGFYNSFWDSRNATNQLVPSGVYFCRLTAGHVVLTRKLIVVR